MVYKKPPFRRPSLSYQKSVQGWPSGTSADSQDTLAFGALTGVRSMTEVFPLERGGSLRAHDERQGAIPGSAYGRPIILACSQSLTSSSVGMRPLLRTTPSMATAGVESTPSLAIA